MYRQTFRINNINVTFSMISRHFLSGKLSLVRACFTELLPWIQLFVISGIVLNFSLVIDTPLVTGTECNSNMKQHTSRELRKERSQMCRTDGKQHLPLFVRALYRPWLKLRSTM